MFGLIVRGHVQPVYRNIAHAHSLNHEFRLLDVYGWTPAASNRVLHLRRLQAWDRVQLFGLNLLAVLTNECVVSQADKFWIAGLVFTKFVPVGLDLGAFAEQFLKWLLASFVTFAFCPSSWNCSGPRWNFLLESAVCRACSFFVKTWQKGAYFIRRTPKIYDITLLNYSCVEEDLTLLSPSENSIAVSNNKN